MGWGSGTAEFPYLTTVRDHQTFFIQVSEVISSLWMLSPQERIKIPQLLLLTPAIQQLVLLQQLRGKALLLFSLRLTVGKVI